MDKDLLLMIDEFWKGFFLILPRLIISILIFLVTLFVARKLSGLIKKRLLTRIDDMLLANFIARISKWIITLVGFVICMDILGLAHFASGLIAGAGVSAIVLGFALKDIGENFLSGVILAFNRPFKIGDVIETKDITGTITSLDLRTTKIKTFDGIEVYVPNSIILNNPLSNYNSIGLRRFDYIVGIDYEADVTLAKSLIMKELESIGDIIKDPEPFVIVDELGANSINLKVFYWVNPTIAKESFFEIKSEAIDRSLSSLKKGGVNIPFDSMQLQFNKGIPEIPVNIVNYEKQ